jgi:uncharacterized protein (TIGR02444 family)
MPNEHEELKNLQLDHLELNNPFWQFSLTQWKNPALQTHLLTLQNEHGFRINLLLLAMWLSFEGRDIRLHIETLITESRAWHEHVVVPLRLTRQCLPASVKDLKQQVQACELQAEQIEQALLYTCSLKYPTKQTSRAQHHHFDSLDWLIINLSASGLTQSNLSLLIQNCLPSYPVKRIDERIRQHIQAS